jgi:hypothetical protein
VSPFTPSGGSGPFTSVGTPIINQSGDMLGQIGGATVEQRGNSVRVYARVEGNPSVSASAPGAAGQEAAGLDTVKRSKVAEVQVGMDRASVEEVLGKPHSVIAIHGDEEIETLNYNLDDKKTA